MTVKMPVVTVTGAVHVSTRKIQDKKYASYEGEGLSVSQHPDAWRRIACLKGENWNISTPLKMLNFHSLTEKQKAHILSYAVDAGWVQEVALYRVSWFDDEFDGTASFILNSREEAEEEADGCDGELTEFVGHIYTDTFPDRTVKAGEPVMDLGIITAAWVNLERVDLDGVWWADNLDVARLSAPRGVISVNKVAGFMGV